MTIDPKTIKERIVKNENTLKKLDERYIEACCPDSYKGVKDYRDTRTEEYSKEKKRLLTLIELDKQLLESACTHIDDREYLENLDSNLQKVQYLRVVRGYTQEATAEILGLSDRHVRRLEKRIKWPVKCPINVLLN